MDDTHCERMMFIGWTSFRAPERIVFGEESTRSGGFADEGSIWFWLVWRGIRSSVTQGFCSLHLFQVFAAWAFDPQYSFCFSKMPKVRTNRTVYPEGWELIEPTLRDLETKMREGLLETSCYYTFVSGHTETVSCPLFFCCSSFGKLSFRFCMELFGWAGVNWFSDFVAQLRMKLTKERESARRCGQFSKSLTKRVVTSTICFTGGKP